MQILTFKIRQMRISVEKTPTQINYSNLVKSWMI